jgi:hypothetical protein
VQPCENSIEERLYGLVTLPNRCVIPCASYVMDYAGEVDSPPAHWISFEMTMCVARIAITPDIVPLERGAAIVGVEGDESPALPRVAELGDS